jgi:hypothetical protein
MKTIRRPRGTSIMRGTQAFLFNVSNVGTETAGPPLRHENSIKTSSTENREVRKGHYEPLATTFKHDGFNYRQIAHEGDFAIYEQRWIRRDGELSENVAFEVIRIQRHEATTFPNGDVYPAREGYPPSESWGVVGFTFTDQDAAFGRLKVLMGS